MMLTQHVKGAQVVSVPWFRYEKAMMVEIEVESENLEVRVGLITAPSLEVAKTLAAKLLESRCVACVNLVPSIESMYRWEGKIQTDQETLMVVKTTKNAQSRVIELVAQEHPYEVPECIFTEVDGGYSPYLSWVTKEVAEP